MQYFSRGKFEHGVASPPWGPPAYDYDSTVESPPGEKAMVGSEDLYAVAKAAGTNVSLRGGWPVDETFR